MTIEDIFWIIICPILPVPAFYVTYLLVVDPITQTGIILAKRAVLAKAIKGNYPEHSIQLWMSKRLGKTGKDWERLGKTGKDWERLKTYGSFVVRREGRRRITSDLQFHKDI